MAEDEGRTRQPKAQPSGKGLDGAIDTYEQKRERREELRMEGALRGSKARATSERVLTRTLSGFLYSLTILLCLFLGAIPTAVAFAAMSWLCCSELFRISRMTGRMPNELIGLTVAAMFPLAPLLPDFFIPFLFSVLMLSAGVWYVWTARASIADVALTVFGPIYTGYLASSVTSIRLLHLPSMPFDTNTAALLTFGAIASIWMSDATAYFVGSQLGRHKMVPKISPNKTWEGFAGGLAGSVLVWLLMYFIGIPGISLPLALVGGFGVGIIGVVGDLFESRLKRAAGVKDSGNVLPGHGGMLDRTDSILFGCMTAYLILRIGGLV